MEKTKHVFKVFSRPGKHCQSFSFPILVKPNLFSFLERLNENDTDKIRFFLSKADTAGTESDRQRVLMQITQELCKRPGLNKCGFDMPTIYIPSLTDRVCLA